MSVDSANPRSERPAAEFGRYDELTADGGVSFRCGACGEAAAVIRLLAAGESHDMGPPLGEQAHPREGVVIDYWLGGTIWMALRSEKRDRVGAVLADAQPDPAALHAITWELAPFWCRQCQACYCRNDWRTTVIFDGPFYDCTDGTCPAGHTHILDD